MQPLSRLPASEARRLRGLLFDLDDTLLDHGKLGEAAYRSLFRLKESGLELYIVTGRPSGWAEVLVRMWPVDGAVTENGAIAVVAAPGGVDVIDPVPPEERRARAERLLTLAAELRAEFPELYPTSDVAARRSDFTFDIGEARRVPTEVVERARAVASERGAATVTSSVHLHIGFDRADKASGALRLIRRQSELDPTVSLASYAFIGDSENDAACFAAFRTSIGVANLRGRLTVRPRYRTEAASGAGFAEAAAHLVCERAEHD